MAAQRKKDPTMEELETHYSEITRLYDYAEELLATVESKLAGDPAKQLAIVEPLINEIGDATDTLAEEFILIAEGCKHKIKSKASKAHIEGALRKIFSAIHDYQARVRDTTKKAHGAIMNIADPVVSKIRKHMEQVVVIFFEFVQISLQSIMSKTELEAFRTGNARVALMMHQHAMAQQQG